MSTSQKSNKITISEEESNTCKIDNLKFPSSKLMIWHVKKTHGLSFEEYIIKCYYSGIRPVCVKTGQPLSFKAHKLGPWFSDTAKNCFVRKSHSDHSKQKIKIGCEKRAMELFGVKNAFQSEAVKIKIRETNIAKYGVDNAAKDPSVKLKALNQYYETIKQKFESGNYNREHKRSSLEIDFESKLKCAGIEYESPFVLDGKKFDFYIKSIDTIIEIDGEAFHKNTLENLSLITVSSAINDVEKNEIAKQEGKQLVRLRWNIDIEFSDIQQLSTTIANCAYVPNYNIQLRQIICKKDYFKNYIHTHGKDKLASYAYLFVKFLKTIHPTFPEITTDLSIDDVTNTFNQYDWKSSVDGNNFRSQKCPKTVNFFLKSIFASYWKSSYKNRKSPVESWNDIELLKEIIKYRIGCNNSDEVFDFSLYEILKGMSARRLTISFFNPFLAYSVYKRLLTGASTPTVVDPCCGFGGRLLGFKMAYPNGIYVGCEPNRETFDELTKLVKLFNFQNVTIHNVKYEDFDKSSISPDLIFTSIPYFDVEKYSESESLSFDDWKTQFVSQLYGDNVYINCSMPLASDLGWEKYMWGTIETTTSHYNKDTPTKFEGIYKLTADKQNRSTQ